MAKSLTRFGTEGRDKALKQVNSVQAAENLNLTHGWAGPELGGPPKTACCRWEGTPRQGQCGREARGGVKGQRSS